VRGFRWVANMGREEAEGTPPIVAGVSLAAVASEHKKFLKGKTIGNPKRTRHMTVAQLKGEGFVGIYEPN